MPSLLSSTLEGVHPKLVWLSKATAPGVLASARGVGCACVFRGDVQAFETLNGPITLLTSRLCIERKAADLGGIRGVRCAVLWVSGITS